MSQSLSVLAANLKSVMDDRGIKSEELSRMTKGQITGRHIRRVIQQEQSITLEKLDAIASALRLPAWHLITPTNAIDGDNRLQRLVSAFSTADEESREFIIRFAERESAH